MAKIRKDLIKSMKEFTFVIITYNQEQYILQHLESIKYQINKYGKGISVYLIISDDHSLDRTLQLAEIWLQENSCFFYNYKIYTSSSNKGIVKNYLKALNKIETAEYKLLAGDDLYYKNNVFQAIKEADILLTPTINFTDTNDLHLDNNLYLYQKCILNNHEDLKKRISKELDYDCLIQAPGSFLKTKIIQDKNFQNFVLQFKWIEDYPQWYYLFKKSNRTLKIRVSMKPYILYRTNVGISSTSKHTKNKEFILEKNKINDQFKNKHTILPKIINPYVYIYHIKHYMVCKEAKHNPELISYDKLRSSKKFKSNINHYLNYLKQEAEQYI